MLRRGSSFLRRFMHSRGYVGTNLAPFAAAIAHSGGIKSSCDTNSNTNKDSMKHFLFGQSVLVFGLCCNTAFADDGSIAEVVPESDKDEVYLTGLQRVEDGSIVSNSHTVKWRIFTDNGRDLSLKGKLDEAERYFILALHEAKEGFGERDAHVASSCNNLAEIYRVRKEYEKAEPLYIDSIKILEESFGPEDIRVGAAVHNLGQFYLVQRKLEEARSCYERALKIKGRVLGYFHTDYADTMYHLGTVLHLLGKEKDAEALIRESIKILEENGLAESAMCIRRMKYLSQILLRSNQLNEVEILQRKILHTLELSKGWDSLDTVKAAESLALTLQSLGNLMEAHEILERSLVSAKKILGDNHIQVAAILHHLARNAMMSSNHLRKVDRARSELEKAKVLLDHSLRIARSSLHDLKSRREFAGNSDSRASITVQRFALITLLQSLDAVGLWVTNMLELNPKAEEAIMLECERAIHESILLFKETWTRKLLDFPDVKAEYLMCLKRLMGIAEDNSSNWKIQGVGAKLQSLKADIRQIESELAISTTGKAFSPERDVLSQRDHA